MTQLKVLDRVYVIGRGYVTIVDNPDHIPIHVGDEIIDKDAAISIVGVEGLMNLLSPPIPCRRIGLVTRKVTHGSEIHIKSKED